jgi:hypothetical protein
MTTAEKWKQLCDREFARGNYMRGLPGKDGLGKIEVLNASNELVAKGTLDELLAEPQS